MCNHTTPGHILHGSKRPNRFVVPGVLLFLAEEATYGYELGTKLANFGLIDNEKDTALIYRALGTLNKEGYIFYEEIPGEGGPARKVYSITERGRSLLQDWKNVIERRVEMLSNFLKLYEEINLDNKGVDDEGV